MTTSLFLTIPKIGGKQSQDRNGILSVISIHISFLFIFWALGLPDEAARGGVESPAESVIECLPEDDNDSE